MENSEKELLVARITAGTLRFQVHTEEEEKIRLCFKKPTPEHIYIGQEIYHEYFKELKEIGCMTEDEVIQFMLAEGLWSEQEEKTLKDVTKDIEEFKTKLYELTFKSNEKRAVRKALKLAKETQAKLTAKRQSYFYLTLTGAAAMMRTRFLVGMSTYYINGKPLYDEDGFWQADYYIFEQIADNYFKTRLPEQAYRELARTEPWRSIWNSRKSEGAVFGVPSIELTEEQRTLTIWSSIYDSVYEHPDCPPDEIVEDDDILDGWMIIQRKKRKQDSEKSKAENLVSNDKIRGMGEVFIPVDTFEDAKKIDDLNDHHSKMIKQQRLAHARRKGEVHEAAMPDSALEIQQELNRQFSANAKG